MAIALDLPATGDTVNDRTRRAHLISATLRYTLLTVVGLIMLYPLIWLVGASFKPNAEIFSSPGFWPENPTLNGYIEG
jgi:oligogalacturonide transport system permease protein